MTDPASPSSSSPSSGTAATSHDDVVRVEVIDGVAVVTMNRPEARNALNTALRTALPARLRDLDADPDVVAMVLTGADPAFCAGLDLKEISTQGLGGGGSEPSNLPFAGLAKPLIGAINGPAVTGGFELALGCDFLIASERASFADTHARVGVMPGWGLTVLLPQAIGIRRAKQMSFTGNYVDAHTALDWGLVNAVVPHDDLVPAARSLATDMATIPPANLAAIKAAYAAANDPVDGPALEAEQAYSRSWTFDKQALADNRQAIQARGSSQAG